MRTGMLLGLLLAAALGGPAAALEEPAGGCEIFPRTQTYGGGGPAAHYGQPVTVRYSADACNAEIAEGTFTMSASGSATVLSAAGEILGTHGFSTSVTAADPENAGGWPVRWWSCSVLSAEHRWEIPGVYAFHMTADAGGWTASVSPGGSVFRSC